ncbi:MAG TPA: peptidase T [Gaiellaceae bacterium]|jgi:tripeptide aminopeptidase
MAIDTIDARALARQLAEDAAERFLRYVRIDTASDGDSTSYPSTEKQLDLQRVLVEELRTVGLADAELDEHGYVTATLPATVDREVPTIGLVAHVDTSPDVSGADVKPQRVRYEGGLLALPADPSQVLDPGEVPELATHTGHELITSDGTTLLGADDKAGVAEIVSAVAWLAAHPEVPHGRIRIAFTPDEEVGRGTDRFDLERFGADAAYTLDGSTAGELQEETFSGAAVTMCIRGRSIHPGWAKDTLVNAVKLAAEVIDRLPKDTLSPETTDGREGYVHPTSIRGDAAEVELRFIVRDFEDDALDEHVAFLRGVAAEVEALDPRARIDVEHSISYRNMRDALKQRPEVVAAAEEAIRRVGLEPHKTAIRGGTDGSALTEKGLPTPNIFTGGQQAHSQREWICVEDMGLAAATIVELARVWAETPR